MADRCEGCEAPATGRDADGVPLCHECGAECETAPSLSELTTELLAEIVETPSVVMLIDEDVIAEIVRQALAAQGWREKASEVPGLSATLDEVRFNLQAMTERAEKAELERGATSAALNDLAYGLRDALNGFAMVGEKWTDAVKRLRAKLAEVERERDAASFDAEAQKIRARTAEERLAEVERERHVAVSVMREMRVAWDAASAQRDDLRTRLADAEAHLAAMTKRAERAERERDEARGDLESMTGLYNTAWPALDSARDERNALRAKLADAERRIAELSTSTVPTTDERLYALAENPTTHTRCEATFQRKRADWWRLQAKRLGWTPDYPELREERTSDARLDCESSSLLLLSTWARRVMMRPKNRAKGVPSESVEELIAMAREELFEASDAIYSKAPTDDILAELGDAAAIIGFAMREIEKRRKA